MADFPININDVSKVQKSNALKSKLKKIFREFDKEKLGYIKETVFLQYLQENGIKLSKEQTAYIKTRFSKSGKILYKEVLARIAPDLTLDNPFQRKWVLRVGQTAKSTVRDFLQSRTNVRTGIGSRGGAGVSGLQYLNVKEQNQLRSTSLVPELSKVRNNKHQTPKAAQASSHPRIKKKPLDPIRSSSQLPQLQSNLVESGKAKKSDSITSEMVKKYMEFPFDGKGKKMVQMYRKNITNEDLQKQLHSKFIYDHQRNYDVVTNQYYDYASPDQYKTKGGYKPKYQDDYTGMSIASDDGRESKNQEKRNTKINMYLAAKHKNNPQFFSQLQQAAKQQNVAKLIHKMMNMNIDPRQVIGLKKLFLKEDTQGKGYIEQKQFRKIFRASISKYQDALENQFIELVKEEGKQDGNIEFEKLLYFVDLYQFFPYIVKKDRNFSADLYNVLSNGLQPGKSEKLAQTEESSSNLHQLLELLWVKIDERFSKIGSAFRYFDTNSNGLISRAEFQLGIQNLHVNLQRTDVDRIFNHMDQDKDNYLSYSEFCQLLQEKRRGLDPGFKVSNASPTSQTSYGFNKSLERKRSLGDDASSFMETMGKNPNLNNSDLMINKHLQGFKLRRNIPKTLLPSMHDAQFTYGVPTIHPDSINDVMAFNYQKQWLEKLKVLQDQQQKMNSSSKKPKTMKQFQTRASKIRNQALLNKIKQDNRKQIEWEGKLNWKISKFKNAKPTQEIVNQYRQNSEYKSKKGSSSSGMPWLNKKMALLKQSVPDSEYQPQAGAVLRDDLAGNILKQGGNDQYLRELENAQRKVIEANETLKRSNKEQKGMNNRSFQQHGRGQDNSNLLDKNMLKELEQGQRKIYNMEDRRNKKTMLNDYFSNKKALNPGRISTAQPGSSGHRINSSSIQ